MKKILVIALVAILTSCAGNDKQMVLKEEVKIMKFGKHDVDDSKAMSVNEMMADFKNKTGEETYTFKGEIAEVCSKMGCWISIKQANGESFMVRFKDHFTIPTDTKLGTEAFLHGIAFWDTVSVEDQKHYLEDAGKSEAEMAMITEPKYEFGFEADGIMLKEEDKTSEMVEK